MRVIVFNARIFNHPRLRPCMHTTFTFKSQNYIGRQHTHIQLDSCTAGEIVSYLRYIGLPFIMTEMGI